MDALARNEQHKYEKIWEIPHYRGSSDYWLPSLFLDHFKTQIYQGATLIDFGCGTGRSVPLLMQAGLQVNLLDIAENCLNPEIFLQTLGPNPPVHFFHECLWNLSPHIKPADWIISFDVLEHIPESKIDIVLKEMASHMKIGGLFTIALCKDNFGSWIGEPLHLTVKPATW